MPLSLDGTTNGVKTFSVSLSTEPHAACHKYFRVQTGNFRNAVETALNRAWSPIVWKNNERCKVNFDCCNLVVLDIDDGFTLDDAKVWLKKIYFRAAILLSKSHQKDKVTKAGVVSKACDRFRILIDAQTISDLDQYEMNMRAWTKRLPMADPSCKDGGRFFFRSPQLAYAQDGMVYHWQDFREHIEAERKAIKEATQRRIEKFKCTGAISEGLRAFIMRGVPVGQRHSTCYWLGCVLGEMGIGFEESVKIICAGPLADIGEGDVRNAVTYARRKILG